MDNLEIFGIPYFKKGSGIHIKKENRGKFTDYCGGKVTNECIQRGKNSSDPKIRKRATFAQNARGWSKKGQNGLKFGWKALDNIDFETVADTTFTRNKTGAGDIEYFSPNAPGYLYPNGYYQKHPKPGKHVILYNPNVNDEQDIKLDVLHAMPEDATYDALNAIYRKSAFNSDNDITHNAKQRYKEDLQKYGRVTMPFKQYLNNEADGLLRNMFIEGTPEYIQSKRYYPDKKQLREWNKQLLPYIDEIHKYLKTGKRPQYILPEVTVTTKGNYMHNKL